MRSPISAWGPRIATRWGVFLSPVAFFALPLAAAEISAVESAAKVDSAINAKEEGSSPTSASAPSAPSANNITAEELVARALAAEAVGCPIAREKLLREALTIDPDYAPAHWQLGELRVGDEWKAIGDASVATDRAGKFKEYRQRRDQTRANAEAQYKLSKWCGHTGLTDQERAHLVFVLQLQPNHGYAGKRLKQLQREAEQASRGDAETARQQARETAAALKEWRPRLIGLRRDAEARDSARRNRGLAGLATVNDTSALPAIENVFADAEGDVGSAVIKSLTDMNDQRAVDSLVRYSVNAKSPGVRQDAAQALGARSMFSYIPSMMSILVPPTRMEYSLAFNSKGDLGYRISLYQEGAFSDTEVSHTMTNRDFMTLTVSPRQETLSIDQQRLQQRTSEAVSMARNVEAANAAREDRNQKIAAALRLSTGNKFDDSPQSWWTWWLDYNEIYRSPDKPVKRTDTEAQTSLTFSRVPYEPPKSQVTVQTSLASIRHPECFAAGTKVWTVTGPMPIEQVGVGESVLSQNTATGELGYKLVVATTIRPISPLVEIRAGNEKLQATRGHPFWVSGIGWRMAKELEPGQWLHTARGPLKVESVERKGEALAYNMLLDGFNTYFVTESMFLVHDNLIRELSPATVPGMTGPGESGPGVTRPDVAAQRIPAAP